MSLSFDSQITRKSLFLLVFVIIFRAVLSLLLFSYFESRGQNFIGTILTPIDFVASLIFVSLQRRYFAGESVFIYCVLGRVVPVALLWVARDFSSPLLQDGGLLLLGLCLLEGVAQKITLTKDYSKLWLFAWVGVALLILFVSRGVGDLLFSNAFLVPIFVGFHAGLHETEKAFRRALLRTFVTALCVAGPFLHYGLLCLVIYSPLLLTVSLLSTALGIGFRKLGAVRVGQVGLVLLCVGCALEPLWFHPERKEIEFTNTQVVALPKHAVWSSLNALELSIEPSATPLWARIAGFPVAEQIIGPGTHVGAVRTVVFDRGEVLATVTAREEGERFSLSLRPQKEGREFFGHWVSLKTSDFILRAVDAQHTEVIHTTRYLPRLYPRFIFEPIERRAGSVLQQALLDGYMRSVETPALTEPAFPVAFR